MSLSTPNSSFIFDLLLRSIKLCAVFLAIFRPATLVEEGAFFFEVAEAFAFDFGDSSMASSGSSAACPLGFICMIFRDRVGGGGRAKASLAGATATEDRLRVLTASLTFAGEVGEAELYEEVDEVLEDALDGCVAFPATIAGGGSSNDIWRDGYREPSLLFISVDEAGVGGIWGRGILHVCNARTCASP